MTSSLIGRTVTWLRDGIWEAMRGDVVAVAYEGGFVLLVLVDGNLHAVPSEWATVEPREDLVKEFFGKERKS